MKPDVLSYAGVDARIRFDADEMNFVGEVGQGDQLIRFSALSVFGLTEEYERAADLIKERFEIKAELIEKLTPIADVVQSGEAIIDIEQNDSDRRIGVMIKTLLAMADGAGFLVREKPDVNNSL